MKIQRFAFLSLIGFFLIIGTLSGSFYYVERTGTLKYISENINQNIFRLEEDIQKTLQQNRLETIQTLLDQACAIDGAFGVLSLSMDGNSIAVSSSRSLTGKLIDEGYVPLSTISKELVEDEQLHYSSELNYYSGAEKKTAVLLIDLDRGFIFERLNHMAMLYGTILFLILGVVALSVLSGVRWLVIGPLERITRRAQNQDGAQEKYLIEELSILDQTLFDTFHSMQTQQNHLQDALNESRYLDGILRTVADINQLLITAKNIDELLEDSCQRLAEHPGYELCHIALKEKDALILKAYSNDSTGYLYPKMTTMFEGMKIDEGDPNIRAIRENKTVVIEHLEHESSWGAWRFIAEKGRYGSVISLPLVSAMDSSPLGVMTLYAKRSEGFEPKEISMLEELAGDIGFAMHSFSQREQLRYHLTTDQITDLPNRFTLVEALRGEDVCALAIINIDRFGDINEVYGVAIGDAILGGYGHWLRLKIASQKNIALYKMGSDEYALVASHCSELNLFITFLEELIVATQKESFVIEGIEIVLTITIGVARLSDRVLEHATAALKLAKRQRHSLEIFSSESKHEQENNIAWYKRIKEAIEEARIVPYFQPIVDNHSGAIIKYEALMRLIEADGSVSSPYLFLDIAKKTKLYPELTKIMIEQVVEVFKTSKLPVSLNLSTQDLVNPELADYLEQVISDNGVGQLMIFEILESEGIENYASVSAFVDRFKAIGCHFAIDDFGSGYSNFDHLLKLNIDTLKIDASLIKNLPHDRNAQIFVKHICDFAHEMGIDVVAEFVANEEIFKRVKEIGIDASQGYYFYEPSAVLVEGN
ncbi:GGDEF domain-containing protein [Sulfuricurvum sp.]|uniref:sensor domain-containing phosphodiesterase n=1 Tax=Sulfuricurvum sp. TaxID=2025608 RepID=UPI002D599D32|nr:GGDEF domain-containing protein [Sulfuricurvum sp.]HZF69738.1 GGDEF domain-containing protein [Sulfuricurvum sp.]